MILYNVTINIEEEIEEEWLLWMKDKHIPDVMATGFFTESKLYKLLSEVPESTSITYSIQYYAPSIKQVNDYLKKSAPDLIAEHQNKYRNKFVAFRTVLESVD